MRKHPYLAAGYQYAGLTCYVLFGDGQTPATLLGAGIVFGLYCGLRRRKNIHGGYMIFYRNPYRQITGMIILVSVFIACTPEICYAGVGEPDYDPVFYYYHSDHLGSSEIMTDRDGDLVQHYGYYPFGDERYSENGDAFSVSNRYTSQILDEDTGLYYYGARYYDPELGRFIQADPIVPGTQNS
jgi:RHS repeat-associated protein